MGICPEVFKTTVVKFLLKKPNLDFGILNDYRPMPLRCLQLSICVSAREYNPSLKLPH